MSKETSIIHHVENKQSDYFSYLNKKKTRWDDNVKLYNSKSYNRKSRWGPEYEKSFTPLTYTYIPENMDVDTFEIVIRKHRLEDINRRLNSNDWESADPEIRSPSPEPVYDSRTGHRMNTREVRTKENYVAEKNSIVEDLIKLDRTYRAPIDYRPPKKVKKLYIPENNEKLNFIGLIIGPRGATQKDLERKCNCKISIRGKGSNWNSNSFTKTYHDEMENLHVFLEADSEEDLRKGISLVEPLLNPNSEEHIRHRQNQKMALVNMYGFNKEHACENCGERGHKSWACPLNLGNFTRAEVQCGICGDKSHPTCDCPERERVEDKNEMEAELKQFFKEMDEFNAKASVPVLEAEIKPNDIRKSVLLTGKIPEVTTVDEEPIVQREIKEKVVVEQNKIDIKPQNDKTFTPNLPSQNENFPKTFTTANIGTQNFTPQPNQNFRFPIVPIAENPNVVRSAPVNYFNNPQLNTQFMQMQNNPYYSMGMNPYLLSGMGGMAVKPKHFHRGLISSNFQGKLPGNFGLPNMNYNTLQNGYVSPYQKMQSTYPLSNNDLISQGNINIRQIHQIASQFKPPEPDTEPEPESKSKVDDIQIEKIN